MLFIVTDPEYIIAELTRSRVTVQTPLTVGHLGRRQSQYHPDREYRKHGYMYLFACDCLPTLEQLTCCVDE